MHFIVYLFCLDAICFLKVLDNLALGLAEFSLYGSHHWGAAIILYVEVAQVAYVHLQNLWSQAWYTGTLWSFLLASVFELLQEKLQVS